MRQRFMSCVIIILCMLCIGLYLMYVHEKKIEIENYTFTESSRELKNPNRGFYRLYSFMITDTAEDYPKKISELYLHDTDTKLTLIQICLKSYRQGAITEEGIKNIEALFDALGTLDKQLVVRFTYDGDGENERYEPENIEIILEHMRQLEGVLRSHSRQIFSLQGLFIGNWGEMNGTRYNSDEDLRRLSDQLADVTEDSTYLAVRMPAQWRRIMQSESPSPEDHEGNPLYGRLGLFNDGMLGNESDYGTYSTQEDTDDLYDTVYPRFRRGEELEFQDRLCCQVPNGGEVINDNSYNALENALQDLRTMHVTYLNRAYDQEVMDKWKGTTIEEESCFNGMDGLTYIERHLGYRLVLTEAGIDYKKEEDVLNAAVSLKNIGFAPLYKEPKIRIILCNEKEDKPLVYPVEQSLDFLVGGMDTENILTLSADIPCSELTEKEYAVYFSMTDSDTGDIISLGNEEKEEQYGYCIGKISIQ